MGGKTDFHVSECLLRVPVLEKDPCCFVDSLADVHWDAVSGFSDDRDPSARSLGP